MTTDQSQELVHEPLPIAFLDDSVQSTRHRQSQKFEVLTVEEGQLPGDPARSLEGWVLVASQLPEETTTEDILDHFTEYGDVYNAGSSNLIGIQSNGMCAGYAFVQYRTKAEAEAAIAGMNGKQFLTAESITVAFAFVVPENAQIADRKRGRE